MNEDNQRPDSELRDGAPSEPIDPQKLMAFGSKQIISLFVPVSICMLMVVIVAKTVSFYGTTEYYLIYTPFHTKDADAATTVWQSLANALILIGLVVVMSVVLVLLYKYKCYKVNFSCYSNLEVWIKVKMQELIEKQYKFTKRNCESILLCENNNTFCLQPISMEPKEKTKVN